MTAKTRPRSMLKLPITEPCAWTGAQLRDDAGWVHSLSDGTIEELVAAVDHVQNLDLAFPDFEPSHFRIDQLKKTLTDFSEELEHGRGFVVLRGLPVDRLSEEQLNIAYFGIGQNMGQPVRQNLRGDLLGSVMNIGDPDDKQTRVYETNRYLPYHTDPSDVFGLLCVRKAQSGGLSSLVSAATIYNTILRKYPEFLALLYRPMWYAHLGEDMPGLSPIFSYYEGKLACRYLRQYIELGHEMRELPLSGIEIEMLDLIDSIAHDENIRLDMMLEPGDIQFANNYTIMHSRTAFEDDPCPGKRRKLLRLWLKVANARALSPEFPGRNGFG